MDPISIISFALQTVQQVIAAGRALHEATERLKSDTLKGVREVDCRELELQQGVAVAKIKRWQDLWFLETEKSEDFFQALWGQTGCNRVHSLLQSISSECTAIQESLKDLTEVREELIRKPNVKRPDLWKKLLNILRLSTKRQNENGENTQLRGKVASLSDRIDELWTDSELHFRLLHGVSLGQGQSPDNDHTNSVLSDALRSREPATRLYWHCQSLGIELGLDLNLLNHDREIDKFPDLFDWSDLTLGYHFLYLKPSDPTSAGEFLAEPCSAFGGVYRETHGLGNELRNSLKDAVSLDSSDYMMHLPAFERAQEAYFHVTSKPNTWRGDVSPEPLSLFMSGTHDEEPHAARDQPLSRESEKISLAYQIVQCGLFLLGTPWFSHLSSQTVLRFKISDSDYQYRLRIQSLAPVDQKHESRHTIERLQLFRIGVVLVDIALETDLSSTDLTNATIEPESMTQVGKRLGLLYKQACEFCLNSRVDIDDPWKEEESTSGYEVLNPESKLLISQYYMEVFMRLRDLHSSLN